MEKFTQSYRNLQIFASELWDTAFACQRIIEEAGATTLRINMSEPSIQRWFYVLDELRKLDDGSMGRLVQVMMKEYPENSELKNACAPWIPAAPATSTFYQDKPREPSAPMPPPLVPVVPVVVPVDFAEDADLIVPRLETLWQAVREQAERIADNDARLKQQEVWLVNMDAWARGYPYSKPKDAPGPVEGNAV